MAVRIQLNSAGMRDLLSSSGVAADLKRRADRVAASAKGSGPVDSGEYVDEIEVIMEQHDDRVVAHVTANARHSMLVEANTGNLARALDAAAG
jgi:hypothetical protein